MHLQVELADISEIVQLEIATVVQIIEGLYKMYIFRPLSIQPLILIVVLVFHTQPIHQSLISVMRW